MTVGERIRAARKRAGLTQLEVAHRMGSKGVNSLVCWEKGSRIPSTTSLQRIAAAIGCPLSELTHGLIEGMRDEGQMRDVVENERECWKGLVYERIRFNDFAGARRKLAVLQGIEYLAEALDLMGSNMSGMFALNELIDDAEAAYILSQEGE